MAIISVIDNQNNRWKRNAKKTTKQNKTKKVIKKGTEAIVKEWKLNDFFVCLGLIFSN